MLKRVSESVARSRSFAWFVGLLERLDREEPDLLRVLTYHRVERSDAIPAPSPAVTIPPDSFSEQMRYLRDRCHVVSVEQLIDVVQGRGRLPRRSVLVTFDDGYRDFRERAWPVLRALELPAALFVPTAFPGNPGRFFWWDQLHDAISNTARRDSLETPMGSLPLGTARERERAFARLRSEAKRMPHAEALAWVEATCRELGGALVPPDLLNWDELRELAKQGVTIGSHTRTHPLLTRVSHEEVRAEAAGSLRDLERELGAALPILAYPAGAYDDDVVRILGEEGYVLAFTTVRGVNDLKRAHPLRLRRINVGRRTSLAVLRAQLTGWSRGLNRFYPVSARAGRAGE